VFDVNEVSMLRKLFVAIIPWTLLVACASSVGPATPTKVDIPTQTFSPTQPPAATATVFISITDSPAPSTWITIEPSSSANQIRTMLFDRAGDLWTGGPGGVVHWDLDTKKPTMYSIPGKLEDTNVVGLLQTPDGAIWVSTFGNGLARYDGQDWQTFSTENGLPGNYISSQTLTQQGELWFSIQNNKYSTRDTQFKFGRFDGRKWVDESGAGWFWIGALPSGSIAGAYNFGYHGGSFESTIGIYDGQHWDIDQAIYPDGWVEAITISPTGTIWAATGDTLYRYADHKWTTVQLPLGGKNFPGVSSMAISEDGVAWFGFSLTRFDIDSCGNRYEDFEEKGVYRYDGKSWTSFTTKDGLVDNKICAITLDSTGNPWFGSFDKGISHFDGQRWESYVIP
jgi:ligand-binding sensor domain-containing protein